MIIILTTSEFRLEHRPLKNPFARGGFNGHLSLLAGAALAGHEVKIQEPNGRVHKFDSEKG